MCRIIGKDRFSSYNDMTDKKQIHIAGKISSSQDGVVVYTDGCVPCHTAGHGNCPKVLLTYGDPIKF